MAEDGKTKKRWKRILSYVLIGFGILSILDLFSPIPIPTTGIVAVVSGAIAITAGFYLLYLSDMDWVGFLKRTVSRKEEREKADLDAGLDPMVPVEILRIARGKGGLLTVSTAAMELNMPLGIVEAGLRECVRRGAAQEDFDEAHSTVVYRFPEFLPPPAVPRLPESG